MRAKRQIDVVFLPVMRSSAMRDLDRIVRAVAAKDVGITLVGESGTGKEVIARRMHDLSHRRTGAFIPINCAAIPEALFESELFGHEKGAFTGANDLARGKVEASHGGTLFLDEIGEMPLPAQAKLLRFLENRKFMRVGGTAKISVDARFICATLRPLEEEVRAGRFRADLYYRIQGISLVVPPLRDRRPDILPLVQQFVAQSCAKHGTRIAKISRAAMSAIRAYDWPGNVRELRNVIELVSVLRPGKQVRVRDLPAVLQDVATQKIRQNGGDSAAKEVIEVRLDRRLDDTISQILDAALELEGGNRSKAAQRLGVSLRTVQRHLARHSGP